LALENFLAAEFGQLADVRSFRMLNMFCSGANFAQQNMNQGNGTYHLVGTLQESLCMYMVCVAAG
jgi:hypothetical protein